MDVVVSAPSEFSGDVIADLNGRNGIVKAISPAVGGKEEIKVIMPLKKMFGYTTMLRSKTKGRGQFSMKFQEFKRLCAKEEMELLKKLGIIFEI